MLMMLAPLASIISIIGAPFLLFRFLGCLCPRGKQETGLACIAQAKPYKMCMLHGFWARFAILSSIFVAPKLVQCVKCGCYWVRQCAAVPE